MNYTSIEQSKKLLELGLNPESADMFYDGVQDFYKEKVYSIPINGSSITVRTGHTITERGIKNNLLLPCWSLGALLEVMPQYLYDEYGDFFMVCLDHYSEGWNVSYVGEEEYDLFRFADENGKTPLEAAYSMVVWLLENGYIK